MLYYYLGEETPAAEKMWTYTNQKRLRGTCPTRRILDDVIILVSFFNFLHKKRRKNKSNYFAYFFHPEGNFDIEAGDGVGRTI